MSTIGLCSPAPAAARNRSKAPASPSPVHSSCLFTFSPSNPSHCHSMGKFHGAKVTHVDSYELLDSMALGDCQQQTIDIGETQLEVALEECRRPLMVAFFRSQQLDAALVRPAQDNQRCLGRAGWCDAHAEQSVGLAHHLPNRAQLPSFA